MLHILEVDNFARGTDHARTWCYCYCDQYHRYGWLRQSLIKNGDVTTGKKFKPLPLHQMEWDVDKFLKQYGWMIDENNYLRSTDRKGVKQHVLIVEEITGIKVPYPLLEVDHIDSNKQNNDPSNLQVLFKWENSAKRSLNKNVKQDGLPQGIYRRDSGKFRAKFRGKNCATRSTLEESMNDYTRAVALFYKQNSEYVKIKEEINHKLKEFCTGHFVEYKGKVYQKEGTKS